MTDVSFRMEYAGYIGDEKVAWLYRAFAEIDQPYVVVAQLDSGPLSFTQRPGEADEDYEDPADIEEADRQNAVAWVEDLTELIVKARAYDELYESIFGIDPEDADEYFTTSEGCEILDGFIEDDAVIVDLDDDGLADWERELLNGVITPYTVDELTDDEDDDVWEDLDGDRYKVIDGDWHILYRRDVETGWSRVGADEEFLSDYGPYTVVR